MRLRGIAGPRTRAHRQRVQDAHLDWLRLRAADERKGEGGGGGAALLQEAAAAVT
jgi:hypothetical protein